MPRITNGPPARWSRQNVPLPLRTVQSCRRRAATHGLKDARAGQTQGGAGDEGETSIVFSIAARGKSQKG